MVLYLVAMWVLVTLTFAILVTYRRRMAKHEADWIPLTDDAREDRAIQEQTVIEMRAQKLARPIWILGTLSIVIFLVTLGYWVYHGVMGPLPPPQ
jgi:uncharacterized membrane protein